MRISNPVKAIETKKRVRVNKTTIALHGGNLAFADFQLTPPLGNNISGRVKNSGEQGDPGSRCLVENPPTERMWRIGEVGRRDERLIGRKKRRDGIAGGNASAKRSG
jgi:hypothetical protein